LGGTVAQQDRWALKLDKPVMLKKWKATYKVMIKPYEKISYKE